MTSKFTAEGVLERHLEVLRSNAGLVKPVGGLLIKAGSVDIRAGEILATDSGTNLSFPVKSTQLQATQADAQVSLEVDDAHNFEIGDAVTVDDRTGVYVVTATDRVAVPNVITIATGLTGGTNPSPVDGRVSVIATAQEDAVAVALSAAKDRETPLFANRFGSFEFGDCAIAGAFRQSRIIGLNSDMLTDLGGAVEIADTYIIN